MAGIFQGKHVVVTGGTGALGSAVVRQLVDAGASVHVPVFNARELERFSMRDEVELVEGVDLTDESSAARFYSSIPTLWASVHLAGGFAMASLAETSAGEFMRMMRLNALSCFLSCQAAHRRIRETEEGGRIVNIAARPAIVPTPGMVAYAASKGGVAGMTLPVARDLAAVGIRVNTIAPGLIDTPIYGEGEASEAFKANLGKSVLFPHRLGSGDELASMVVELITNDYMNGETLRVDGGIRMPPK